MSKIVILTRHRATQIITITAVFVLWSMVCLNSTYADEERELRKWTDDSGKFSIDASFVKLENNTVTLKRDDNANIEVPFDRLSKPDRQYIESLLKESNEDDVTGQAPPAGEIIEPGDCPECHGSGIVPITDFRPLVHFTHKRRSKDEETIGFCACRKCQADRPLEHVDPRVINDPEDDRNEQWKDLLGGKLREVETHYYLIHSQLDDKSTRKVALGIEKMQQHLQKLTGSMFLIPVRRSEHDILLIRNRNNYLEFLERVKEERPPKNQEVDWAIMPMRTSSWIEQTQFTHNIDKNSLPYIPNCVVCTAAFYQIGLSTNWNSADWLCTGFGAYNEHHQFGINMTYPVKYVYKDPKLAYNWDAILKGFVREDKLESWERLFDRRIRDFQDIDYVQSKSMVTFLLKEPKKFLAFLRLLKNGAKQIDAIEQAYGESLTSIEQRWKKSLR